MKKRNQWALILWMGIFGSAGVLQAATDNSSFVVTVMDYSMRVVSPDASLKKEKTLSVIIENKTISKLIGKVEQAGKAVQFISLAPNSFQSVEFANIRGEQVQFIPLAPAFQEALLEVGQKSYEIPPQR